MFFYVLEGKGIVKIGDETQEVSIDMLIDSPAKIPHRLMNNGDGIFRVLVVKVPKPTESTRLRKTQNAITNEGKHVYIRK